MKFKSLSLLAAAIVFTVTASIGATTPAKAQFAAAISSQIYAQTPLCGEHPDYPVVGRVIAYYADVRRSVRLAFVGCFPSFPACEAWRKMAYKPLNPPIIANRCEERR